MAKAPQANLRDIGLEGFALVDKFYGPPRRSDGAFPALQGYWAVQAPSEKMEEPAVINSKDAATRYAGIMVMNYPNGIKPPNRRVTPIKA